MPVLRLFAAAREAAGTASAEVPGVTVDQVLDAARARFGPELAAVIDASKVWRNGEPASGSDPVEPGDEVAVLPPVSGGSEPDRPAGGRPRRPTFAPAEPPPSTKPAPASRRSPSAEAAAARRVESADRAAEAASRRSGPSGGRAIRPRAGEPGIAARGPDGPPAGRPAPSTRPPAARAAPTRPPGGGRRTGGRAAGGRSDDRRAGGRSSRPDLGKGRAGAGPRPGPGSDSTAPAVEARRPTRTSAPSGRQLSSPDGEGRDPATRLTRMRSVGVPVTGSITLRGKERKVSGVRERRTTLGRRYGVVYDTDGPKVTLGVLWFLALMGSVALGWSGAVLAFLLAIAAGWAAMEAADRWREQGVAVDPWVAALGAGTVAGAATGGTGVLGAAIVLVVLAAVVRTAVGRPGRDQILSAAGNTVGCAIPFGLAAGSVVLTYHLEIGAVVALLLFVAAYDAGDYLIGSGSSNSVEGPLTGIVTIGVVAMAIAVLGTPPFEGVPTYTFAAFAAILCPLGQMAASAILPANDAHAPSVRRLDSLLLLAPIWVWSVGIFIASR